MDQQQREMLFLDPSYVGFWFGVALFISFGVFFTIILLYLWIFHKRTSRRSRNYQRVIEVELPTIRSAPPAIAGMDLDVRARIPKIRYVSNTVLPYKEDKCVCCMCEFMEGESVSMIPNCRHTFHSHCIDSHMAHGTTCPCCRRTISLEEANTTTTSTTTAAATDGVVNV